MPELPEVETIVRQVRPRLTGRKVTAVQLQWRGIAAHPRGVDFSRALVGAELLSVWRRGKFFVVDLARDGVSAGHLIGHLRMSGRLYVEPVPFDPGDHVRASVALDDGWRMHFVDPRKFGRLWCVRDASEVLGELGPEPLDEGFSLAWLTKSLRERRRSLKPLLLDQSFVAGLGNIYVDEALWDAKLHPNRIAAALSINEIKALHRAIPKVLKRGLKNLGTSLGTGKANFYSVARHRGRNKDELKVFRRTGLPCPRCKATIKRIIVGQRSTHICPKCQEI